LWKSFGGNNGYFYKECHWLVFIKPLEGSVFAWLFGHEKEKNEVFRNFLDLKFFSD
jgi:hypothetical protein